MTRREWLAAVALAPGIAAARAPAMLPIVDTHQHLWDTAKLKPPWIKPGDRLDAPHTPKEYAEAVKGLNVVKAIYMEVGMAEADQQREAEFIIELCKSGATPTCAAVVAGNPASDGFARYVEQFRDSPYVKGIRHMLHVEGVKASDGLKPEFLQGLRRLGELGLRFDLCIRPQELAIIDRIVGECRETKFILDHCGNPQRSFSAAETAAWRRGIDQLAQRANVVCKVSGIVVNGFETGEWKASDLAPFVNAVLDSFGPDRVMFGGDWPVCTRTATFAEWVNALKQIVSHRPEAEQRKLFHDNAVKYYGLA